MHLAESGLALARCRHDKIMHSTQVVADHRLGVTHADHFHLISFNNKTTNIRLSF